MAGQAGDGNGTGTTLEHARAYLAAGISVIPIINNGTKKPIGKWERYQHELATPDQVEAWWQRQRWGIAGIGGKVSGGREVIDFDDGGLYRPWRELVESQAPGLVARLPVVQTPTGGYHVHYRCEVVQGNQKLALRPGADPETGKPKAETLIETRGEGGYVLLPGSPPACHPSGKTYRHVSGPPLTEAPLVTAAEREMLLTSARSFDLIATAAAARPEQTGGEVSDRPGDDYKRRGPDWLEILGPHGWQAVHHRGAVTYWRRPGKDDPGWSATTGYCHGKDGAELLAVFSSNADPFPGPTGGRNCSCHTKFDAYARLNHGGDYKAAAKALAAQGYGEQRGHHNGRQEDNGPAAHAKPRNPADEPPPEFVLGPLTLRPRTPRRTPSGKLTVELVILKDGQPVEVLPLANSSSGRCQAGKCIRRHLGGDDAARQEVDGTLSQLVVWAAQRLEQSEDTRGGDALTIVRARVPELLQLRYRTVDGALWSETRQAPLRRHDFLAVTPPWLVTEVAEAIGASPGDAVELLRTIRAALEIAWADLMEQLPRGEHSDLGADSAAAQQFRAALVTLWRLPRTWEKAAKEGDPTSRASLVARARSSFAPYLAKDGPRPSEREKWRGVLNALDAWWRPHVNADGQIVPLLAMRWTLAAQIGVALPNVCSEASLTALGRRYGLLDPAPPVNATVSGTRRLAVLAPDVVEELMDDPAGWEGESQ
jgi:hypothetical protein